MKSVLLVDLSSIYFAIWHASAHEEQNAAWRITQAKCKEVMSWRDDGDYSAIAWCVDSPPYNRAQIREDYKANREKRDPKAFHQYLRIQQWLTAQGELVWGAKGMEADDILATACAQAPEDVEIIDLHTGDKDLLQLVDDRVQIIPTRNDGPERYDANAVQEKFGVTPAQFAEFLALCGDKSDNIPGVPSVGPKKAAWLLNEIGNLEAIREAASDVADRRIAAATRKALNEHRKELMDSELLVKLRTDAPIRFEEIWEERERLDDVPPPDDDEPEPEVEDSPPEDDPPEQLGGPPAEKPAAPPAPAAPQQISTGPSEGSPSPVAQPPPPAAQPEGSVDLTPGSNKSNGNGHTQAKSDDPPDDGVPDKPAAPAKAPSVAIERSSFALTYEPDSRKVAWWLATTAAESKVFPAILSPHQAYIILQVGRELGLTAMASLRGIKMVKGNPMIMSTLLVGIILESGRCEYFECTETTPQKATYITRRKGRPERDLTYTIEEAREAGLLEPSRNGEPSNYAKRPKTMLRHRAAAELARMVYPEIASGVYVFGEDLGHGIEEPIEVMGVEMAS